MFMNGFQQLEWRSRCIMSHLIAYKQKMRKNVHKYSVLENQRSNMEGSVKSTFIFAFLNDDRSQNRVFENFLDFVSSNDAG